MNRRRLAFWMARLIRRIRDGLELFERTLTKWGSSGHASCKTCRQVVHRSNMDANGECIDCWND